VRAFTRSFTRKQGGSEGNMLSRSVSRMHRSFSRKPKAEAPKSAEDYDREHREHVQKLAQANEELRQSNHLENGEGRKKSVGFAPPSVDAMTA
jgi:hypothetical protein